MSLEAAISIYARSTDTLVAPTHGAQLGSWILPSGIERPPYVVYANIYDEARHKARATCLDDAIAALLQMAMEEPNATIHAWDPGTIEYQITVTYMLVHLPMHTSIHLPRHVTSEWSRHPTTIFIAEHIHRVITQSHTTHNESWNLYAKDIQIDPKQIGSRGAIRYTPHPTDTRGRYTIKKFCWKESSKHAGAAAVITVLPIDTMEVCRVGVHIINHTAPIIHAFLLPYDPSHDVIETHESYIIERIPCTAPSIMDALHAWTIPECSQHAMLAWRRVLADTNPHTNPLVQAILRERDALQQDLRAWTESILPTP